MNVNITAEINFHQQDQASVYLETDGRNEDAESLEIFFFCLFAIRQLSNLGVCEASNALASALILLAEGPDDLLQSNAVGGVKLTPYPGTPGRKQYVAHMHLRGQEVKLDVSLGGFSLMGTGHGYYAPNSVLVLLRFLAQRHIHSPAFQQSLRQAAAHCGACQLGHLITLSNHAFLAFGILSQVGDASIVQPIDDVQTVHPAVMTSHVTAASWMAPAGSVAVVIGGLGFIASGALGGGPTLEGAVIAGALNPLFFIGVPLGLYWLYQYRYHCIIDSSQSYSTGGPTSQETVSHPVQLNHSTGRPSIPKAEVEESESHSIPSNSNRPSSTSGSRLLFRYVVLAAASITALVAILVFAAVSEWRQQANYKLATSRTTRQLEIRSGAEKVVAASEPSTPATDWKDAWPLAQQSSASNDASVVKAPLLEPVQTIPKDHLSLGKEALQTGDYDLAITSFEASAEQEGALRTATNYLAFAHGKRGEFHFERGEFKEAINDIIKSVELHPQSNQFAKLLPLAYFQDGMQSLTAEGCETTIRLYSKALDADPSNEIIRFRLAAAYAKRSRLHQENRDWAKARADWEQARSLKPDIGNYSAYSAAVQDK